MSETATKRTVVTTTRRPNGRHVLLIDGEAVGEAWKKEGPGFSLGLTGFFWRDGKPNRNGGASGTTVKRLKDAVALAERILTAYRTRDAMSELSPLFGVPFRFWVCPQGCRGPVTWSETGATCAECGASSDGAPKDLAAYVEALAVEHGGIAYADLMALATQDVDADRLLLAVEGLVNRQNPRLVRVFVDQANGADLPEVEVSRLLGLAAGGDQSAMEGVEVIYRPVLTPTDPGA